MQIPLDLNQLAVTDKFLIMEQLWQDLSSNASESGFSPKWHINLLNSRDLNIKEGRFTFNDLDEVKERLQKLANEN